MYVYNGNPNVINYQYTNTNDLMSAVKLLDTYLVVIRSNKVMDAVVERLSKDYPGISAGVISGSLSMGSVAETGVLEVRSRTTDPQLSADICNAVVDVAPAEIIRVVGAGSVEIIDYATVPTGPNPFSPARSAMNGATIGALIAAVLLVLLFLLNRKVTDIKDLKDNYTVPVLSSVRRSKKDSKDNKKVTEKDKKKEKAEDEKFNELDEDDNTNKKDEEKKDEKKEEVTPKKPKRQHTSQQTIEDRGVGYRIQAYTDNNVRTAKAAAQQRARDIAMKFPQYRSYISYKAPAWRLRIGDFKTQREAQAALQRIKSVYPKFAREMVIVRDRINIWSND